jgi:hypothetical protein
MVDKPFPAENISCFVFGVDYLVCRWQQHDEADNTTYRMSIHFASKEPLDTQCDRKITKCDPSDSSCEEWNWCIAQDTKKWSEFLTSRMSYVNIVATNQVGEAKSVWNASAGIPGIWNCTIPLTMYNEFDSLFFWSRQGYYSIYESNSLYIVSGIVQFQIPGIPALAFQTLFASPTWFVATILT